MSLCAWDSCCPRFKLFSARPSVLNLRAVLSLVRVYGSVFVFAGSCPADDPFRLWRIALGCSPHCLGLLHLDPCADSILPAFSSLFIHPRFWGRFRSVLLLMCPFCLFQENFASSKPWTDPEGLLSLSVTQRAKLVG